MHRNISSAHIYFDSVGQNLKLGSAANVAWKEFMERDQNINFLGEHYYLSPSVVEGKKYGKKDEAWALGMLLREMTTLE